MKKSLIAISIATLLLIACTPKEKAITVPDFLRDPDLLKNTQSWCNENPSERQSLPNCFNVGEAAYKKTNMHDEKYINCYAPANGGFNKLCVENNLKRMGMQ